MSIETHRDPRDSLVREKYFSLHPKPLERWLWKQGLPQAAERVFWLHWEEGMKRGDWCSEISLRQVARECCVDPSTVTRAYQLLRTKGLIRREDPGRDPGNPFQQAIAITEVRVPRDLLIELGRAPNRPTFSRQSKDTLGGPAKPSGSPQPPNEIPPQAHPKAATPAAPRLTRAASSALMGKLSGPERAAFFVASRDRLTTMAFDAATTLAPEERGQVLQLLAQLAGSMPPAPNRPAAAAAPAVSAAFAKPRHLSPLEAARLRKAVVSLVPLACGAEVFRQVLWSVEEGALRRFEPRLAANIALKKIREGAWSRPNRMPPNWMRNAALTETCSAA